MQKVLYASGFVYFGGEGDQLRDRFRREEGLDASVRVAAGLADINFDGRREIFLTGFEVRGCGRRGCATTVYGGVNGVWEKLGFLWAQFDDDQVPEIYIREEVVDGVRTYYSSGHSPVENPAPDGRVKFGKADEMISAEEWVGDLASLLGGRAENFLFGRFAMDNDGIDEIFVTKIGDGGCSANSCMTNVYTIRQSEWVTTRPFESSFLVPMGKDGLPHIYVRDEFVNGYRTIYTSLEGPRERVPFPEPK